MSQWNTCGLRLQAVTKIQQENGSIEVRKIKVPVVRNARLQEAPLTQQYPFDNPVRSRSQESIYVWECPSPNDAPDGTWYRCLLVDQRGREAIQRNRRSSNPSPKPAPGAMDCQRDRPARTGAANKLNRVYPASDSCAPRDCEHRRSTLGGTDTCS